MCRSSGGLQGEIVMSVNDSMNLNGPKMRNLMELLEIEIILKPKTTHEKKSNLSLARRKRARELKNLLFEINYDKHNGYGSSLHNK